MIARLQIPVRISKRDIAAFQNKIMEPVQ